FESEDAGDLPEASTQTPQHQQNHFPSAQLMLASSQLAGLTALLPTQQQLLLQQAQAQLLAAAMQQSNAAAAAAAVASQHSGLEPGQQPYSSQPQAAPLALSQPIQITAQDLQQLLQLQQLVLVPGHHLAANLQGASPFLLPSAQQGQQ
ncbi:uncharacterized protein LOC144591612, partial [Rhinoraja longicauda]